MRKLVLFKIAMLPGMGTIDLQSLYAAARRLRQQGGLQDLQFRIW